MKDKNLEYYMSLPYGIIVNVLGTPTKTTGYEAYIDVLTLSALGKTIDEAIENLHKKQEEYISMWLKYGKEIPEPLAKVVE